MDGDTKTRVRRLMDDLANEVIDRPTCGIKTCASYSNIEDAVGHSINSSITSYRTGSTVEGMDIYVSSDVDWMECLPFFPKVCWDSQVTGGHLSGYVIAEHNIIEPAYLMLKVVDKDCLDMMFVKCIDENGYLNSNEFMEVQSIHMKESTMDRPISMARHGPAVTFTSPASSVDAVFCLKCETWPPIADDFFRRERQNWPSPELLNKLKAQHCFVVATPHPSSVSKEVEWRMSFSISERTLIQEMCEPFGRCMYCLKCVKTKYFVYSDSDKPKPFCSYFIKTSCLWMCERFPLHCDYMNLIRQVLDWIIDCYQNRNLPHYFIPKQNLIGHLSEKQCDDVCTKLQNVKLELWKVLMLCLKGNYDIKPLVCGFMCDELKVDEVNELATFEPILLSHPRAIDVLNSTLKILQIEKSQNLYCSIIIRLQQDIIDINLFIMDQIHKNANPADILRYPEEIILPIIEKIEEIVTKGQGKMFKTRLYRYLGDLYTSLLICLRNKCSVEDLAAYKNKPLHYYTLGAEMVWPDNSSDLGIGSRALVVKYHYLMGNSKELKEELTDFENVLDMIDESEVNLMYMFLGIEICALEERDLSYKSWEADQLLQHILKSLPPKPFTMLHPVACVLYIMARVSLKEGNTLTASEIAKLIKKFHFPQWTNHTEILINIIESLIGLQRTMEMIARRIANVGRSFGSTNIEDEGGIENKA